MKKILFAVALAAAFTLTTTAQKRTVLDRAWKVDGKPVYDFEEVWSKAVNTDEKILAVLPNDSVFLGADEQFIVRPTFALEVDAGSRKGNTVTFKGVLVNGRPARIQYGSRYHDQFILFVPRFRGKSLQVGFARLSATETAADFIVIGEGLVTRGDWEVDTEDAQGSQITTYYRRLTNFSLTNVYVFLKATKEAVYRFDYDKQAAWERNPKQATP